MQRFFSHDIDIILLMRRYGEELKMEQKQARELEKQAKKSKLRR